jgi:hypothetical protein
MGLGLDRSWLTDFDLPLPPLPISCLVDTDKGFSVKQIEACPHSEGFAGDVRTVDALDSSRLDPPTKPSLLDLLSLYDLVLLYDILPLDLLVSRSPIIQGLLIACALHTRMDHLSINHRVSH